MGPTGLSMLSSWPSGSDWRPRAEAAVGDSTMTLIRVRGEAAKDRVVMTCASGSASSEAPAAFASAMSLISRLRSCTWPAPSMYAGSGTSTPPALSVATARTMSSPLRYPA